MTSRTSARSLLTTVRRFVLGPWPISAGALWAFLSSMVLAFTWRLAGPNPMVPQTESLSHRLLVILATGLTGPAVVLVPLIVYRTMRLRITRMAIHAPEYLLTLAAATLLAAVVLTGAFHAEPLFSGFLGDPSVGQTWGRILIPVWFMNAVVGSVIVRFQKESTAARAALETVVVQRRLILESEERVRGEVAAFLHERVQTDLVSIGLRIRAALPLPPDEMTRELEATMAELERVRFHEVRKASRQLSPNLDQVSLDTALRDLADAYRPGMTVTVDVSAAASRVLKAPGSAARATGIYRICEQGLLNAAIHGHANACLIRVALEDSDSLKLTLDDNGVGLPLSAVVPGMGSTVISAWVESLQGQWSLEPASVGMTLTATIPTR